MTDKSFNPILKTEEVNYIFNALSCYKESIFSHIFYNAPFWNDVQSGSPSINIRRGRVFSNTKHYLDVLWNFSVAHLYNITLLSVDASRNVSTGELYLYLGLYKDFLIKNIGYNRSVVLRYHHLNKLVDNGQKLFRIAFERTDFNDMRFEFYRDNISQYSPFNTYVIAACVVFDDKQTGSLLTGSYLSWCRFIIDTCKSESFLSETLRESIHLLKMLLYKWVEMNQKIEKDNSEVQ